MQSMTYGSNEAGNNEAGSMEPESLKAGSIAVRSAELRHAAPTTLAPLAPGLSGGEGLGERGGRGSMPHCVLQMIT